MLSSLGQYKPYPHRFLDASKPCDYRLVALNDTIVSSNGVHHQQHREDELCVYDNSQVIWSHENFVHKRYNFSHIHQNLSLQQSIDHESKVVLAVCFCDFRGVSNPHRITGDKQRKEEYQSQSCLCVLLADQLLHIYSPDGKSFRVALPCQMRRMWALNGKLLILERWVSTDSTLTQLPILFSLIHPLEQLKPVAVLDESQIQQPHSDEFIRNDQQMFDEQNNQLFSLNYFDDPNSEVIYVNDEDNYPLIVSYNRKLQTHSIYNVHIETANYNQHSDLDYYGEGYEEDDDEITSEVYLRKISANHIGVSGEKADTVTICDGEDGQAVMVLLKKGEQRIYVYTLTPTVYNSAEDRSGIFVVTLWETTFLCHHDGVASVAKMDSNSLIFCDNEAQNYATRDSLLILLQQEFKKLYVLYRGQHKLCELIVPQPLSSDIVDFKDVLYNRITLVMQDGSFNRMSIHVGSDSELVNRSFAVLRKTLPAYLFASLFFDYVACLHANPDASQWQTLSDLILNLLTIPANRNVQQLADSNDAWASLLERGIDHFNDIVFDLPLVEKAEAGRTECSLITSVHAFREYLPLLILTLHLLYDSLKLDVLHYDLLKPLATLLSRVCSHTHRIHYCDLYYRDFPELQPVLAKNYSKESIQETAILQAQHTIHFFTSDGSMVRMYLAGDLVPNITETLHDYLYLERWPNTAAYPTIKDCSTTAWAGRICRLYHLHAFSTDLYNTTEGITIAGNGFERVVLAMIEDGITSLEDLRNLPFGISVLLRQAISACRTSPPMAWDSSALRKMYRLLGRQDLLQLTPVEKKSDTFPDGDQSLISENERPYFTFDQEDDEESLQATSGPVSIASEHQQQISRRGLGHMVFPNDNRLDEVFAMLNSSKAMSVKRELLGLSDDDLDKFDPQTVEAQPILQKLRHRILSLSTGRGMITFGSRNSQPTDTLPVPAIVLSATLKRNRANMTIDASLKDQEFPKWPEFHNGVAAGLCLQPDANSKRITREWIVYHRPKKPSFSHAGLLLGLGLQGHLAALAPTDVFHYLCQRHEGTTISMLLGLAASKRGTQDSYVARTLSLHIPSLVLSSDLEMPFEVQSAALVGVGLLYLQSANRFMTDVLLSELARAPSDNNTNGREGYSLAAGMGIGLICLGQGSKTGPPAALADLKINERLFRYMVGGNRPDSDPYVIARKNILNSYQDSLQSTKRASQSNQSSGRSSVDPAHKNPVLNSVNSLMACSKIQESSRYVNVDVTGPGSCIALMLMYLQTHNEIVAKQLAIPQTRYLLDYVRPDMVLLRIVGSNLIMWNQIQNSHEWIMSQIPSVVLNSSLIEDEQLRILYAHMIAGCCFTLGLRYAGSNDATTIEVINKFLKEFEQSRLRYQTDTCMIPIQLDKTTAEYCVLVCLLALSCVVAGTGDVETARTIRRLRKRFTQSAPATLSREDRSYGSHLALSMALGLVFLGGGQYSLSTTPLSIASLICSLYPRFPVSVNDNQYHLQAFRHLYALAAESRLFEMRDVDTGETCFIPFNMQLIGGGVALGKKSPCLIPELHTIESISTATDEYYPLTIDLKLNPILRQSLFNRGKNGCKNIILSVKKRPNSETNENPDAAYIQQRVNQAVSLLSNPLTRKHRPTSQYIWNLKLVTTFYQQLGRVNREYSGLLTADFVELLQSQVTQLIPSPEITVRKYFSGELLPSEWAGSTLEWFGVPSIHILKSIQDQQRQQNTKLTLSDWCNLLQPQTRFEVILLIFNILNTTVTQHHE